MNSTPDWLDRVERRAGGKPVLLVEGDDDVTLLGHFLSQHTPGWSQRLYLGAAGSKQRVVRGVGVHRPDWVGIVDLDEWRPADLEKAQRENPRLFALPRFCIESYFCVPEELWAALPERQRQRVGDNLAALRDPILAVLPDWVAHGAMWRVLRARREGLLNDLGFPAELEQAPITDEAKIRAILQTWYDYLEPDDILAAYRSELERACKLTEDEQLNKYVHGKKFFNQVVVQVLDKLFSGKGRSDWLSRFRAEPSPILPPSDLGRLLDDIMAVV